MRLTRVYVEMPLAVGAELALPEGPAAHLARVLRLAAGDRCVLFNGDGQDYPAIVTAVGKRELRVRLDAPVAVDNESSLRIVLLQGVARGEKMDLILQKATELGVAEVRPLVSQRSEVKLDAARAARRLTHWQGVVIAACEQCGRARVPRVAAPLPLSAVLAGLGTSPRGERAHQGADADDLRLLLDPDGELALNDLPLANSHTEVILAVGPEGGWSPDDRGQLLAAGFAGLRLGPRILRTETAGLAAIAALQAGFGDLN
ncbi:16S rRNA (uracil(1498)-N(3))-methyltransferase [Lysobacter sp. A03]|uniref:16S rRNA (uracil(1498)-N(3))-methyltransferase n=1 Tax=Lysobacter sp. A03 TaxID=1199154 RepID=UPI0005B6B214|nr:16S rRNA (uracil(1498)-N(3))-methyltransferase [Lysobacter sp. A03]KIQ97910.1 Ribosomal RNA small subunit methyltransferase E [Lysobacter sp. A03]